MPTPQPFGISHEKGRFSSSACCHARRCGGRDANGPLRGVITSHPARDDPATSAPPARAGVAGAAPTTRGCSPSFRRGSARAASACPPSRSWRSRLRWGARRRARAQPESRPLPRRSRGGGEPRRGRRQSARTSMAQHWPVFAGPTSDDTRVKRAERSRMSWRGERAVRRSRRGRPDARQSFWVRRALGLARHAHTSRTRP